MDIKKGSRIVVIGAGISGIAAANILKKNGFVPIVFEKSEKWAAFGGRPIQKSVCKISTLSIIYPIFHGPSSLTSTPAANKL